MPDDPNKRGRQDRSRISLIQEHERLYWQDRFDCSEAQLRAAIEAVGDQVADVERQLQGC
jgi:hypothetical protein